MTVRLLRILPAVPLLWLSLSACGAAGEILDESQEPLASPVCRQAKEGASASLSCDGGTITSIQFASYGTPTGTCGSFQRSSCHAGTSRAVVEAACLGKASCTVAATNATFTDPCVGTRKRLAIEVECTRPNTGVDGGANAPDAGRPVGDGGSPGPADGGTSPPPPDPGVPASCVGVTPAPGQRVDMAWPNPSNVGHTANVGNTVRFRWSGSTPHNVIEGALFEGNDPATGVYADVLGPRAVRSGAKTSSQVFDWNTGVFPCGYRPGQYYFMDENNPSSGIVALDLNDFDGSHYAPKSCSRLSDRAVYDGRYAAYAGRSGCTQFEVNNFQTGAHYDWVEPTFGATQGDLILFRWSGLHNVVQVHDVYKDKHVPGGILSGPRTVCAPGASYTCANGGPSLGEYLIDTQNHRPGMIHISDGCAYGCNASCPWKCNGPAQNATGMNMQFLLSRRTRPTVGGAGSCCALDRIKGQACRVIDVYNDNEGLQFDYNVPFNRGDLVRIRWGGTIRLVQTTAAGNGGPTRTPRAGGLAMSSPVECIPGPSFSCLGGNTDAAQLVIDIDKAARAGQIDADGNMRFFAFGENTDGFSSADSGLLFWTSNGNPYANNPPCP